jgi:hypothetical protein
VVWLGGVVAAVPQPQAGSPIGTPAFSLVSSSTATTSRSDLNGLERLHELLGSRFSGIPSIPSPKGGHDSWSQQRGSMEGSSGFEELSSTLSISPIATGTVGFPESLLDAPTGTGTVVIPTLIDKECQAQSGSGRIRGTENGIVDKNCCTDLTVVFARGTGEVGNVGTVSGPPMFRAIRQRLGSDRVTIQGVDYPASSAVRKYTINCLFHTNQKCTGKRQHGW